MIKLIPHIPEYKMDILCKGLCSYCGGKARLYNYISYLIYKLGAGTFFELCAGAATVSLNIRIKNKVINDVNIRLAVIYKALSAPETADCVLSRLKKVRYCSEIFYEAHEYWEKNGNKPFAYFIDQDLCDAAYYSWILLNFSRVGSSISKRFIDDNEQMYDFMRFQQSLITYYGKLYGAEVHNESVLDILQRLADNPEAISDNTVIYIDPPYLPSKNRNVKSSDVYSNGEKKFSFTADDHRKMLELADKLPREKCRVIISGYDDRDGIYRSMLDSESFGDWSMIFVKELVIMSGDGSKLKDKKRPTDDEYFFTNFYL